MGNEFSELCPLFNTGLYQELTLPRVKLLNISTTTNIHAGFCFGRSVVVTAAWVVKAGTGALATATVFNLMHATTANITVASQTLVASYALATSSASQPLGEFLSMNMVGNTTFGTTDIVNTSNESIIEAACPVSVVIRYKEA